MAKGYSQREGIDFKETFSPVSTKDSLLEISYFVTTLFVLEIIILVANNNLQPKNIGHKVIAECSSGNAFYYHSLTFSQIICLRDK